MDSIEREALRQHERKLQKQKDSIQRKKQNYYKNMNKKKIVPDNSISLDAYKKLGDDKAKIRAEQRLKEWCHRYILLRDLFIDVDGKIKGKCIGCGKIWVVKFYSTGSIMNFDRWCASHYFRKDMYNSIAYDEINLNLSCWNCNVNLSGNLNLYKINLIAKRGQAAFDALELRRNNPKHYNILELIKLKEKFMDLTKIELTRLGIKL